MKKWLFSLLVCLPLHALPLNNPKLASLACDGVFFSYNCALPGTNCDTLSVRLGYYGDFVFNNYMEVDHDDRGSIRLVRIYTNGGEIDFNLWNRFDIFGMVGVGNVLIEAPIHNFSVAGNPVNSLLTIDTSSDIAWSVGARGTVWECGRLAFGVEGQYYATTPSINYLSDHFRTTSTYLDGVNLQYRAWQIGLGATYEICITPCFSFLPYAWLAGEGAHVDMGDARVTLADQGVTVELFDLQKERYFGYAFGGTLVGGERILITAEGRFAYEKALFLSIQMRL